MQEKKIKKTFYIDDELVKKIKIKSAVDENTETDTLNEILTDHFSKEGQRYTLKK